MKSILPNFNCMRTAEVQFSEIKLISSLKYILGRWDGGRWVGGRWTVRRCDGGRWTVIGGTVDGAFGKRLLELMFKTFETSNWRLMAS